VGFEGFLVSGIWELPYFRVGAWMAGGLAHFVSGVDSLQPIRTVSTDGADWDVSNPFIATAFRWKPGWEDACVPQTLRWSYSLWIWDWLNDALLVGWLFGILAVLVHLSCRFATAII